MRFDIARQPLVPAFLTLLALALLAAGSFGAANAAAAGIPHAAFATAPDGLVTGLPQQALLNLQLHHPLWAGGLGVVLLLAGGLHLGRLSTRYNLYGVSSCLAIPLYGAALCLAGFGDQYLTALTESLLLVLAFKNYCRAFGNGYRFDALFRASLSLGLLPLLRPALLPLVAAAARSRLDLPTHAARGDSRLRRSAAARSRLVLRELGRRRRAGRPAAHIAGAFTDGAPSPCCAELTTPELFAAGILVLLTLLAAPPPAHGVLHHGAEAALHPPSSDSLPCSLASCCSAAPARHPPIGRSWHSRRPCCCPSRSSASAPGSSGRSTCCWSEGQASPSLQ